MALSSVTGPTEQVNVMHIKVSSLIHLLFICRIHMIDLIALSFLFFVPIMWCLKIRRQFIL